MRRRRRLSPKGKSPVRRMRPHSLVEETPIVIDDERLTRWQQIKVAANRGDYNLQFLLLFFSLPGLLWIITDWLEGR